MWDIAWRFGLDLTRCPPDQMEVYGIPEDSLLLMDASQM